LAGSQSAVEATNFYGRGWGSAASEVSDGATLSWLVKEDVAGSGTSEFYLSQNGGGTIGGIILSQSDGKVQLYGSGSTVTTSYAYTVGNIYKLEMVLDFTNGQFTGYATNVTNSGSRTLLGAKAFNTTVDAASVALNGGVILGSTTETFWDDIQITAAAVPEPGTPGLLSIAGLMALRRRRNA